MGAGNQDDLYQATLGGIPLDIEDTGDTFDNAVAEYKFPYQQGSLLEDMGQNARQVKFRCYFMNETYQSHFTLLDSLNSLGATELVHPKYGLIKGLIKTIDVRHDDRKQTAQIDITFIENLRGAAQPAASVQVQSASEEAFTNGQQDQMDWCGDYTLGQLGPEGAGVLAQPLDFTQPGVLSQFSGLSMKARAFVATVDTYVRAMDGALTDIENPASGLISVIDYGTNLPGRVISSVARAIERYALLYNTVGCAPARFLSSLQNGISALVNASAQFGAFTRCAGAHRLALETAYVYDADEQNYQAQKQQEGQKSFDALGNYIALAPAPAAMTVNDLEATLALVNTAVQASVTEARANGESLPGLKAQALALLTWVEQVKMERATVINISVANPAPLHLICLQYGLDYHAAERVYAINKIKRPSFTHGDINIYAG